jgi:ubiquinone/menaquinone biosynthesis C-methylase UbiE
MDSMSSFEKFKLQAGDSGGRERNSMKTKTHGHTHGWVAGMASVAAGVVLMHVFPSMRAVSKVFLLVGLFHLVGATLVIGATVSFAPPAYRRAVLRLIARNGGAPSEKFDFGWSTGAMNILWLIGLAFSGLALGLQLVYPALWPVWFLLALLAVNSFVGNGLLRTCRRVEWANLPMVDLLSSDHDHVLDAGCGAGRTIVSLSRVLKNGRITALDRFDADYIEGGGKDLLQRNLALANVGRRVSIEAGDITQMPFPDATFDSAVSAHAMDHLGKKKRRGLSEVYRVLKPGGRFLMVVWVPGWAGFAMGNVFSFLFATKQQWRKMSREAGFEIQDEGLFNGVWYVVLRKAC